MSPKSISSEGLIGVAGDCQTPEEVLGIDQKNPVAERVLAAYNRQADTHIKLGDLQKAYRGNVHSISKERLQVISEHIGSLIRFVRERVAITTTRPLAESARTHERLIDILNEIKFRVHLNSAKLTFVPDAVHTVQHLEHGDPHASSVREILGRQSLSMGDRITEQHRLLRAAGVPEANFPATIDPNFLVKEAWPAYLEETRKLYQELTDASLAAKMKAGFIAAFRPNQVPKNLLVELEKYKDPIEWIRHFYKRIGVYLGLILIGPDALDGTANRRDDGVRDSSDAGLLRYFSELRDFDTGQFRPCVARGNCWPIGTNANFSNQQQMADTMSSITGRAHIAHGRIGIMLAMQQAELLQGEFLKDRWCIRACSRHPDHADNAHIRFHQVGPRHKILIHEDVITHGNPYTGISIGPTPHYLV